MKKNNRLNICSDNGVTLVEMMVVMVIFLMLTSGLYAAMVAGDSSFQINSTRTGLHQELRKAMDHMVNDLRQAGSASVIDVPADDTWYNVITFQKPSGISSGSIAWNGFTTQYLIGGGNQLQRIENGTTKIVAQSISLLEIRRSAATSDRIDIALQANGNTPKGTTILYDLDFSIEMRN